MTDEIARYKAIADAAAEGFATLAAKVKQQAKRIDELLAANNREVERRRAAEKRAIAAETVANTDEGLSNG